MKFGGALKKTRKDVALSQEDMAELLNFSRSSISKLEIDFNDLKAETLVRWGHAIALFRTGQATSIYEAAALTATTIDASMVLDVIIKMFGGLIIWI